MVVGKSQNIFVNLLTFRVDKNHLIVLIFQNFDVSEQSFVLVKFYLFGLIFQKKIDKISPFISDQKSKAFLIPRLDQLLGRFHFVLGNALQNPDDSLQGNTVKSQGKIYLVWKVSKSSDGLIE